LLRRGVCGSQKEELLMPEIPNLSVIRRIESAPIDKTLMVIGKTLVYVGIVIGLYVLLRMVQLAGFLGFAPVEGLLLAGFVVLYHAALGFMCQGLARALKHLEVTDSAEVSDAAPVDPASNDS